MVLAIIPDPHNNNPQIFFFFLKKTLCEHQQLQLSLSAAIREKESS